MAHKLGIVHRDIKPGNLFLCGTPAGHSDDEPFAIGGDDLVPRLFFSTCD